MEHWLERIVEPDRLILAWQEPDGPGANRTRWAVGWVDRDGDGASLTYLGAGDEFARLNPGYSHERLESAGYAGYPAFSPKVRQHRDGVIEAFRRRLPPRSRADFAAYARHFRIPADARVSDFGLLGLTEARLPSDGFSLVDPLDGLTERIDLMLEVAGFRHYAAKLARAPTPGQPVGIVRELGNPHDPQAVMIRMDGHKIGNINRLQAGAFSAWLATRSVRGWVERVNGRSDHPRLFVFVRVRPGPVGAA